MTERVKQRDKERKTEIETDRDPSVFLELNVLSTFSLQVQFPRSAQTICIPDSKNESERVREREA